MGSITSGGATGGTNLGGLFYTVTVDTQQLLDAERQSDKSGAKISASLTATAKASQIYAAAAGTAAAAVKEATRANDAAAAAAAKTADATDKAAKATQGYTMSAKALAAATRNIPAQATDIITGLSTGQSPLTVLLQQGGQLKDMFGGALPAARALGGYIAGLLTPFTAVAAAVGLFAYGLVKGKEEIAEFNRNLILTGSQSGVTADQLNTMAAELGNLSGIARSEAAAGLNVMVQAGIEGERNLGRFTEAAIRLEKAGGQAIEKTADAFKALARDPVKASEKLNESVNFLTKDLYLQIRALEEQGQKTEAATLAQNAYADAILRRTPLIMQNLGYMERAWNAVKDAVKGAADAVLDIGRVKTLDQQVAQLDALVKRRDAILAKGPSVTNKLEAGRLEGPIESLRQQIALAGDLEDKSRVSAQMEADKAKGSRDVAQWADQGAKFLEKQAKMQAEIKTAQTLGVSLGLKEQEIQTRIAQIKASYAEKKQPFDQDKYLASLAARAADEYERVGIIEQEALRENEQRLKQRDINEATHEAARTLIVDGAAKARRDIVLTRAEEMRQYWYKSGQEEIAAEAKKQADLKRAREGAESDIVASDPIATLELELQRKLAINALYAAQDLANEELYAAQRVALKQRTSEQIQEIAKKQHDQEQALQNSSSMAVITAAQSASGEMLEVLKRAGKDRTAIGKAIFLADRALAVANIIISTEMGAAKAIGEFGPYGIGVAAVIKAAGYASAGMVAGMAVADTFGGGRQYGGPVTAGKLYKVNETGRPEMFTAGGSQFMLPTKSGSVTPADEVGGKIQVLVQVTNTHPTAQVTAQTDDTGRIVQIAVAEVANQIASNNGPVWSSMRSATNVQSRL